MGFLVGCFESFGNIMYVAVAVVPMGQCITYIVDGPVEYEPLYWLAIYCASLTILIFGGKHFFTFTTTLGVITLLLIVLYILGTIPFMDFNVNVTQQSDMETRGIFRDGFKGFLFLLPISSWFYVGIDAIPLICSDAIKVQWVCLSCVVCLCCLLVVMILLIYGGCSIGCYYVFCSKFSFMARSVGYLIVSFMLSHHISSSSVLSSQAQITVPRAIVACMSTIFVFSFVILFATSSQVCVVFVIDCYKTVICFNHLVVLWFGEVVGIGTQC